MSLEQQIATLVGSTSGLTQEVANKMGQIDGRVAGKITELEEWRKNTKSSFNLPYTKTILVGGDANTYYAVPLPFIPENNLARLVIRRYYGAPHPPSLGESHVADLLLEIVVRGSLWNLSSFTRVMYYAFAYHQSVAALETHQIGRVIWLRGGGMQYIFSSDTDLSFEATFYGSEVLKPLLGENSTLYPEHPNSPYAGGGVKVPPRTLTEEIWKTPIRTLTNL